MNFMQRLMYGRYGGDQLSVFLIALYLLLYLLSSLLHCFPGGSTAGRRKTQSL